MKYRNLYLILVILNLTILIFFIIQYTGATYPMVGSDYRLFGPRLLDTLLHYKINGFSIQWYTPSFGGGLPAYPNPLQMQFSLQQILTFISNPWIAILTSGAIYLIIGFWVTFLLIRDVFEKNPLSAILSASFFISNGFFIERLVVGHADKITFPLIIIPIYAVMNRKLPGWLAGAMIGITGAVFLNSGGVYVGVICLFSFILAIPLSYFIKPSLFSIKKITPVILWGFLFTFLLCGSKFYAVTTYMQTFPREVHDHYFVSWVSSIGGAIMQLVGVMTTLPILHLLGKNSLVLVTRLLQWTGSPYGFWEIDSSISPALIVLLVYGSVLVLVHKHEFVAEKLFKKCLAGIFLVLSIILVVQFATARGFLFEQLTNLPLLKSLRTNTRFMASFVLPLAILGGTIFDHWIIRKSNFEILSGFGILNGLTLVSLWAYYLLPMNVQGRNFDIRTIIKTYTQVQAGNTFPVQRIIPEMNDYEVFDALASNVTHHYDPLLGENSFHPLVHEGSVFDVQGEFYNMTDPTGYVFPTVNHSKLFSLIPVSDYDRLVEFVNRRQPDWKLPLIQIVLDWAAGLTIILILFMLGFYLIRKMISEKNPSLRQGRHPDINQY